jgi:hypothetical protein
MVNGTLKTVKGDVTNPQRTKDNEIVVIPHCCNNLGVMGAGVALALKRNWPEVETTYHQYSLDLGNVSFYTHKKKNGLIDVVVANMIGQNGTVSIDNSKPVKYVALVEAMKRVVRVYKDISLRSGREVVIHCPKFGSDLAGGNWDFILELIREIWIENGIDVVVYEFE